MRVLHLVGATDDNGGVLTVLRNLQTVTAGSGVDHVVWVNAAYREVRPPPLQYRFSRYLLADSPSHLQLFVRATRALPELRRLLSEERFDVLHGHSRGGLLLCAWLAGRQSLPVVFTNHGFARRRGLYRWIARKRPLATILLNPNMSRHYDIPADGRRVRVVSECCNDRFFEVPVVPRRSVPDAGPVRLVGLGNIVRWKNWHLWMAAMRQLNATERARLECHHFGPVPRHDPACEAYAKELEGLRSDPAIGRWMFHGPTNGVEEALRQADWFVLPSTDEPNSVALIEALALGVPALVSASGGNVNIVQAGQTGLMFEPDNAAHLAEQLRRIALGQATMLEPAAVRETVRFRGATPVGAEHVALYRELTGLSGGENSNRRSV